MTQVFAGLFNGIASLFGGGPQPQAPPIINFPAVPQYTDPAIEAAARSFRTSQAGAAGRQSTIATSGEGDTSDVKVARKTLLGG